MGSFKPIDAGYRARVEASFHEQKFMGFLGAELLLVEPGYCEVGLAYSSNLTQQNDYFHAGIVATLADNAAGYAAFSLMHPSSSVLTVEYKINLMSPAQGERLVAEGQVEKSGRTLSVCRSKVFAVQDGERKLCAVTQSTIMQLKP